MALHIVSTVWSGGNITGVGLLNDKTRKFETVNFLKLMDYMKTKRVKVRGMILDGDALIPTIDLHRYPVISNNTTVNVGDILYTIIGITPYKMGKVIRYLVSGPTGKIIEWSFRTLYKAYCEGRVVNFEEFNMKPEMKWTFTKLADEAIPELSEELDFECMEPLYRMIAM